MEDDLMLSLLPLEKCGCSSLSWPPKAEDLLVGIRQGRIRSGDDLVDAIADLRSSLSLSHLSKSAFRGFSYFFDQIMSTKESSHWYNDVFPNLAKLLLDMPSLLEAHYKNNACMDIHGDGVKVKTALRVLESQQAGFVCLSQELIAALLACLFFCLFPVENRPAKNLPVLINFDQLFANLFEFRPRDFENEIWCLILYFQRISSKTPKGIISFERRVFHENDSNNPAESWSNSAHPLCKLDVHTSRFTEDHTSETVDVYFAGKNFGADVLDQQKRAEMCFLFSPELIAGMLFLPAMRDNEAIEIVGVERFTTLEGYKKSFQFSDVYVDETKLDTLGRRKTRIVFLDELCIPRNFEYTPDIYLSEINMVFCGMYKSKNECDNIGVATTVDWNCIWRSKDEAMNAIIKWLAASQAGRPFLAYYTKVEKEQKNLRQVAERISSQGWTVGDVWNKLMEYALIRRHVQGFDDCFSNWVQRGKRRRLLTTPQDEWVLKRHKPTQDSLTGPKS